MNPIPGVIKVAQGLILNDNINNIHLHQTTENMKKLSNVVNKNGFVYNLIKRNDFKAIYSQHTIDGKLIGHEVFRIQIGKEAELFGKLIPEREKFPADNDFGVTAWSIGADLDKAMERYEGLKRVVKPVAV